MLYEVVLFAKHFIAKLTFIFSLFKVNFCDVFIMISDLWEWFSATFGTLILFFFSMGTYVIIKFAQATNNSTTIWTLALEKSVFLDSFPDYIELIDFEVLTAWHRTTETTLCWDEIQSGNYFDVVMWFYAEFELHMVKHILAQNFHHRPKFVFLFW